MVVLRPILLSTFAGLSTGIGGILAIMKRPREKVFGLLMGFATGIMLSISFLELLGKGKEVGFILTTFSFGIGAFVILLLDILLPHITFSIKEEGKIDHRLYKTGIMTVVGVTLHNLPEGLVVTSSYLYSHSLGALMAILIAFHNIPEGIATVMPLYKGGLSKLKALRTSLLSGLAEPFGAILALLFLKTFKVFQLVSLSFAAGVMVFISLDELLPIAHKYGKGHFISLGLIFGLIFSFILSGLT